MGCWKKEQEELIWQMDSWNQSQKEKEMIEEVMATIGVAYQEAYKQKKMSRDRSRFAPTKGAGRL